jgi:hypothetical protein
MNNELGRNLEGEVGLIEVLSRHLPGGTEGTHEKTYRNSCNPGRDSKRAPHEYESRVLPLH